MRRLLFLSFFTALVPTVAWAAGGPSAKPEDYLIWGIFITIAYFAASGFERFGQAGVVGALIAGVALAGLDGIISIPDLTVLSAIGMAALLFEAGLESDLDAMKKELIPSMAVAITGVILPAIAGAWYATTQLGIASLAEVGTFAVALTATSVGVSLQVLKQLELSQSPEARIIIGAAVLDDILGMAGLAALSGLAVAGAVSNMTVVEQLMLIVPVLVGLAFIGGFIVIGGWVNRKIRGERRSLGVAAAFTTVALAIGSALGIAPIISTFVAGAVIKAEESLHDAVRGFGLVLYPAAFLAVGLLMDWSVMSWSIVPHILLLSALAFVTKFVAGFFAGRGVNKPLIGAAMASRGEVGLAVVSIAKTAGWIGSESFAILTGTIIVVTVAAPFVMKACVGNTGQVRMAEA